VHPRAQSPERLDFLLGARDDDCVKTKQKSREGGRDGPEKNAAVHIFNFSKKVLALPFDSHANFKTASAFLFFNEQPRPTSIRLVVAAMRHLPG
jgi:hypothetical protein